MLSPKERVKKTLHLEEPDLIPIHTHASRWTAKLADVTVPDYYQKAEAMVAGQRKAWELLRNEIIYLGGDITIEAEALGCRVTFREREAPAVEKPILETLEAAKSLRLPDPERSGRMPTILQAIEQAAKEFHPHGLMFCGEVTGPFTLVGYLRGVSRFIMDLAKQDSNLPEVLSTATEVVSTYAEEQIKAGAELILISDPLASGDIIPPTQYETYVAPYQREVATHIKKLKAYTMLHICGRTQDRLKLMAATGMDALSLDAKVDIASAKAQVGSTTCLAGNINPTAILAEGKPPDVEQATEEIIAKAGRGGGLILMPGCGVPHNTPTENMEAFVKAARQHGQYPLKP